MGTSSRVPVLVGAAAVQQREDDPARALEPLALMGAALLRAAEDAGVPGLLARADLIAVPRGFWDYSDPGRRLASRFGASGARTLLAEIGVLQTTLLGHAAAAIARGQADVVLVTGGEARHRAARARALGREPATTAASGQAPDTVLRPADEILTRAELSAGLGMPVAQYAVIENALRAQEGIGVDAHRREVAELWAAMSRVATENPDAWRRDAVSADAIRLPEGANRMLAFPYTKLHCSQWNVDQAAGLVLCSLETARILGVPPRRMVFPLAVADSDHMVPLSRRRDLHRSPGFALAGSRALARAGRRLADVDHLELYSCFPSAVRVQQRELDVPRERAVTVTGGMTFAGGPLNNFVLQAVARMAHVLRSDPGSTGLVTAVSGLLTKQGVCVWSTEAGEGFAHENVSEAASEQTPTVEIADAPEGGATLASYTVIYEGEEPSRAVLLCDLEDGRRAIAVVEDDAVARAMTREEFCGRGLQLGPEGRVAWR